MTLDHTEIERIRQQLAGLDLAREVLGEDTYQQKRAGLLARLAELGVDQGGEKSFQAGAPVTPLRDLVGDLIAGQGQKHVANTLGGAYIEKADTVNIHAGETNQPDATTLRTAYLNRLHAQAGFLSLAGIDPKAASEAEARLSLASVYTALLTLTPEMHEQLEQMSTSTSKQGSRREEQSRRLSALEQLNKHPHLVLLGDPGSGKTTFINFVALCLSGEALGKPDIGMALLQSPLPEDDERQDKREGKPQAQPWGHGALLPVRVILRDFAARGLPPSGEKATARHLWDFIVSDLQAGALGKFEGPLADELLKRGGLLLLDGLDEVPEAEMRRAQIKEAIEDFAAAFARCRILVTSRTYAYQKQDWRLGGFTETILAPFSRGQINQFIERWYAHIAVLRNLNPSDAQGRAEALKRAISSSDRLRGLAERPLLLTLMASLHAWRGGTLPDKREELYADTVDLLLDWWEQPKAIRDSNGNIFDQQSSLAEFLKVDRQKVRALLEKLAFQAHTAQPELTGTADIPGSSLVSGLMQLSKDPDIKYNKLVDYLSSRAGLLIPRGVGVFTFPHRTFQEYLAACYLTDHDYPEKIAELACADFNRWREVALLAGAKAARGTASAIWSLADALCYSQVHSGCDEAQLWGAHLAGMALAETADVLHPSPRNQEKLNRVRSGLVVVLTQGRLPATERAEAGCSLAQLGDLRLEVLSCKDMQFCFVPQGVFWMGSDKKNDSMADDDEAPIHQMNLPGYWISRFPVTQAQFDEFVQAKGYHEKRYWGEAIQQKLWNENGFSSYGTTRQAPDIYGGPFDLPNHPVVGVSWYEALAFARWLGEQFKRKVVLPSEAEWEKAARGGLEIPLEPLVHSFQQGTDAAVESMQPNPLVQRIYPWGVQEDPNRANYAETGISATSATGCFPGGASPYGCQDLSGNVWEWTRSLWGKEYKLEYRYPYTERIEAREDLTASKNITRVLRGGSFHDASWFVRCAYRLRYAPDLYLRYNGFRVCLPHSPQA